jgi:predicted XRE-type DNA-binding protein
MEAAMIGENWKDDPLENTPPVRGSGSFLDDRGYHDPIETRIKFSLVSLIRDTMETRKLRQIEVAAIVNEFDPKASLSQPDISRILRGNVKGYSQLRLMTILAALGNNVSIVVEPVQGQGRIRVCETAAA